MQLLVINSGGEGCTWQALEQMQSWGHRPRLCTGLGSLPCCICWGHPENEQALGEDLHAMPGLCHLPGVLGRTFLLRGVRINLGTTQMGMGQERCVKADVLLLAADEMKQNDILGTAGSVDAM